MFCAATRWPFAHPLAVADFDSALRYFQRGGDVAKQ